MTLRYAALPLAGVIGLGALAQDASAQGLTFAGPHHEIYLGDPRKVEPARLKTVLRQPVRPR